MPLKSNLFADSARLNACLVQDQAHIKLGDSGDYVEDIQIALGHIDGLVIDKIELVSRRYGPSTATAVLAYKKKRKIINRAYQSAEDDIVGKMTIASLDAEMVARQKPPVILPDARCTQAHCPCRRD
jgi:peptidoglycan hydrolase-like protein with peptidoglycan-binding domain